MFLQNCRIVIKILLTLFKILNRKKFIEGSSLRNVNLSFRERGINVEIFQARIIQFKVDDFLLTNKSRKRLANYRQTIDYWRK